VVFPFFLFFSLAVAVYFGGFFFLSVSFFQHDHTILIGGIL